MDFLAIILISYCLDCLGELTSLIWICCLVEYATCSLLVPRTRALWWTLPKEDQISFWKAPCYSSLGYSRPQEGAMDLLIQN